jgi:hypothetical protein
MRFFVGSDLGQQQDYTAVAVAVAERIVPLPTQPSASPWQPGHVLHELWPGEYTSAEPPAPKPVYHLRHLQRFPLKTSYPDIVAKVKSLLETWELRERSVLAADHTGVGVAVVNMLEDAKLPCILRAITIHGGDTAT